ncbi:MAG: CpsD/CapB family tyrosine-protein kinase [Ruminococcus sp.]|nr:CpsD/CapB family tyrosine-protein kinase [Ruminococcus sp.]
MADKKKNKELDEKFRKGSNIIKRILRQEAEYDFQTREAFNLTRTNLMLSFAGSETSKVVGITSSIKGEGKSFVACSIGHALAEADKTAILIDCDMRLPTVASKVGCNKRPGLSNILTGSVNDITEAVNYDAFGGLDVIPAGDIPPNPSELLGSERFEQMLKLLGEKYDYIILDLPPVTAVTDAIVVSKVIDGIILVVRHEYTDKNAVKDAIRQLNIADARILGFVYNGMFTGNSKYGKYGKYGKYKGYYGYGYGYGYGYENAGKTTTSNK